MADDVDKIIDTKDKVELKALSADIAKMIVSEQLSNKGLSGDRLSKITTYLTAHFMSVKDKNIKSEKMGDASITYADTGLSLMSTTYGQTAAMLDTSGTLNAMTNENKVQGEFTVL